MKQDQSPVRKDRCLCGCGEALTGRQRKWASEECKLRRWHALRAEEALASLPQGEFRRAIRRVCEMRWGGLRGRMRVRFGKPWMLPGGPGPRS